MKAAIKFIMTLAGLILIGGNIGTVLLLTQFEWLLLSGLTRQAGQILDAEVHLESVRIDWPRQALELKGVSVFNPQGFTDREALGIESVTLHPQMLSLFAKTPVINRIALVEPTLHLQHTDGSTNLGAMMNHARAWADDQGRGEAWVVGRKLKLDRLECGPLRLSIESPDSTGSGAAMTLDAFSVDNPGGDEAASGARVIHLVFRGIAQRIGALDGLVNTVRETLLIESSAETPAPRPEEGTDALDIPALPLIGL